MLNNLLPLTQQSKEKLIDFVFNTCINKISNIETLRAYYTDRDLAYVREYKKAQEATSNKNDKGNFKEFTVPVVLSQYSSIKATLNNIFTSRTPIFQAVAGTEFLDEASKINAIFTRHANQLKWRRNLSMCIGDGLRYNLFATEVDWVEWKKFRVDGESESRKFTEVLYSGNSIERLDPYNTFFDTRVSPADMYMHGEFAGYVDFEPKSKFQKFWFENRQKLYVDSKPGIGTSELVTGNVKTNYYVPSLRSGSDVETDTTYTDWSTFLDDLPNQSRNSHTGDYTFGVEKTKMYCRLVPADFGINVPDAKRPQIFQLIFANRVLIHASLYISTHDYIPILFGQPNEDGLNYQSRSVTESVEDIQTLASKLWNAEILATRRVVSDRGIYDPTMIDPKAINSPNTAAKIPLKRSAYSVKPSDAYYQIPYSDPALGLRLQQAASIFSFADQITGQNPVKQGQFVKGNKTNEQFQESMGASESRIIDMAILLEDQFFSPLKFLLLENVLTFQAGDEIYDEQTKQLLKVNPQKLREVTYEFEIADGLFGPDKTVGLVAFTQMFQNVMAIPQFQSTYDIEGALAYLAEINGAKHFKDYKLTPEKQLERAQRLAQQQAIINAGAAGGTQAGQNEANNQIPPNN